MDDTEDAYEATEGCDEGVSSKIQEDNGDMPEFRVPVHLEDLELPKQDRYCVSEALESEELEDNDALEIFSDIENKYLNSTWTHITYNQVFDKFYSAVKFWSSTASDVRVKVLDLCCENFSRMLSELELEISPENNDMPRESIPLYRNSYKMWTYIVAELICATEKIDVEAAMAAPTEGTSRKKAEQIKNAKKRLGFDFGSRRAHLVKALADSLEMDLFQQLWPQGICEKEFGGLISRAGCGVLANPNATAAADVKKNAGKLITVVGHKQPSTITNIVTVLVNMIQSHDHLPKLIVDALKDLKEQYHNTVIISDIIREVARLNLRDSKDSAGVKNVAAFINELASALPVSMLQNVSMLLPHLDAEIHTVRSTIVSCLGHVVRNVFSPEELKKHAETDVKQGTEKEQSEEDTSREDSFPGHFSVKTRDALIDVVEERFYDIHALTRAAAIRTAYQIVSAKSLPIERWTSLTARAIDRLQDKSSLTRRAALQLLTVLLENNPFSPTLNPSVLQQQVDDVDSKLQQFPETGSDETVPGDLEEHGKYEKMKVYCQTTLKFAETMATCIPTVSKLLGSKTSSDVLEAISFLRRARAFSIPSADGALSKMLTLIWTSEKSVKEAILDAFIIEYLTDPVFSSSNDDSEADSQQQFEIEGHMRVFRQSVAAANTLIKLTIGATLAIRTSMEKTLAILADRNFIQDDLIEALWQYVGRSLSVLTEQARRDPSNSSQDASHMQKEKKSIMYGRAAMNILSMLAASIPKTVDSEQGLKRLLAVLAGPSAIKSGAVGGCDYRLAHYACVAAQRVCAVYHGKPGTPASIASVLEKSGSKLNDEHSEEKEVPKTRKKGKATQKQAETEDEERDKSARSRAIANLIICIVAMVRGDWDQGTIPNRFWYPAAEAGIAALFVLAPRPENVCESIIRHMASPLFPSEALQAFGDSPPATQEPPSVTAEKLDRGNFASFAEQGFIPRTSLSRLFFVLGHVALKSLVFFEAVADASKKTRQTLLEQKEKQNSSPANAPSEGTSKAKRRKSAVEEGSLEDQLGTGGNSEDQEAELVSYLADQQLVTTNILGVFAPILAQVAADGSGQFGSDDAENSSYMDPLRQSAVLALSKFMCISSELCEQYLQLLFTILKRASSPALRATVAIALGDLAFRFPNQVEPWTEHLYLCLRDSNASVRKNTLMVLTHLILNDMIKVKGQVAEIAVCLQDDDERIADLTMLFFHELSKRGSNPIYNIMPDIIACLVNHPRLTSESKSSEESFRTIMKYLLSFISKDKHIDALIERLIGRLGAIRHEVESTDIESSQEVSDDSSGGVLMARHLVFCLSQLPYSEKGYKKIMESYKVYKHALKDEKVVSYFNAMLAKAKKFAKSENKANIAEWEQCISQAQATEGEETASGEAATEQATKESRRASSRASSKKTCTRQRTKRATRSRKQRDDSTDSTSEEENEAVDDESTDEEEVKGGCKTKHGSRVGASEEDGEAEVDL
eukprot:gb/GECG01000968.1/.p1 GENE.gb/GECG01000968.1/~~gb/GECG01000968.1/.p1  ORF type:complete len:1486 (+),score=236.86 gb/GECG01000968.1/:1-4458(+)